MSRSSWKFFYVNVDIIKRFDELLSLALFQFKEKYKVDSSEVSRKFFKENVLEISSIAKALSEEEPIEVWSRNSVVLPEFQGFYFFVYNGHVFQKLLVKQEMIGKKFGEFAATKRIGPNIHYPKKKKKV